MASGNATAATKPKRRALRGAELLSGAALSQALEGAPSDVLLPSGLLAQRDAGTVFQAIDEGAMTATFVILTTERNRHGNSHQITGGKLGKGLRTDLGFDSNPVVLFDHGLSGNPFPIARSSKITRTASEARATAHFPERLRDVWPANMQQADDFLRMSAAVFAAIAEGMLRMSSIGCAPLLAMLREQEAEAQLAKGVERMDCWRGLHFVETELREWSVTPIGADRGALKQTLERGRIHDVRLPGFLRQSFASAVQAGGPDPVTVPAGIDVAGLGQRIDRLTRQVARLAKRLPQPERPAETQATAASGGEIAVSPAEPVATEPQTGRIAAVDALEGLDSEALADAVRQGAAGGPDLDLKVLEDALGSVIRQSVGGASQAVEAVENDFHRRLGRVA